MSHFVICTLIQFVYRIPHTRVISAYTGVFSFIREYFLPMREYLPTIDESSPPSIRMSPPFFENDREHQLNPLYSFAYILVFPFSRRSRLALLQFVFLHKELIQADY